MKSALLNSYAGSLLGQCLLAIFRFRTRDFLRMRHSPGVLPPVPRGAAGALYLHIPFCPSLCPFCSFHRVQHQPGPARRYFHALRDEIRLYHAAGFKFSTAYFGGGTPTCEPAELAATIHLLRDLFPLRDISVETNPRDLRPEILESLRQAGVTRLSVGVQSFDDTLLEDMQRLEKYGGGREIEQHLRRAAGIFPTLNIDLIFNLPRQTVASFERDLEIIKQSGANQVSCYPLMSSPAAARKMALSTGLPDPRRLRAFYCAILQRLPPDFQPSSAWCFTRGRGASDEYIVDADYYIGVGSGAFSFVDRTLYATTFCLHTYQRMTSEGLSGIAVQSRLSQSAELRYALLVKMFGLNLDRQWALRRYGPSFFRQLWPELLTLKILGAAAESPAGWRLTERGMYWLMLMMSAFFESVSQYRELMRAQAAVKPREANFPSAFALSRGAPSA